MKKYLLLTFFIFCVHTTIAQNINIKDGIAYVNDKAYVKIEKKSNKKFFLYDLKTNEKLVKIKVQSFYNKLHKRYDYNTSMYFYLIKKDLVFRDIVIKDEIDLIQFLHSERVFLSNNPITTTVILEEYERLSARAKCNKILENDFSQIINDHFVSIVKKDTIIINEVKYKCVNTAFYTQKVMYDRFGKWHKTVFPYEGSRHPNLIWKNIKLLEKKDKKFTVVARGYEGHNTIYASMMIFDELGNDMLAEEAPHRFQLIELFGYYIKNNSSKDDFYEAYWTTFNPERWKKIQEHKRTKNSIRAESPFFQKPSQPRTTIQNN